MKQEIYYQNLRVLIFALDTDDWWKKKLKHQIEILKKNKNINFIFSN